MPPVIDADKCTCCGLCVDLCPEDVYYGSRPGELPVVTYPRECIHFNCCEQECPADAIRIRIPLQALVVYKPTPEEFARAAGGDYPTL